MTERYAFRCRTDGCEYVPQSESDVESMRERQCRHCEKCYCEFHDMDISPECGNVRCKSNSDLVCGDCRAYECSECGMYLCRACSNKNGSRCIECDEYDRKINEQHV